MPRNDQISRQWLLLRKLEASRGATLQELVDSLPEDYPKNPRTIRRDLEALGSVGFPVYTEPFNGRTRWKLTEGFKDIPALGFSPTELMALIFSRNLLRPLEGTEIQASLASALNKAAAALPPQGHEYVRGMERVFCPTLTTGSSAPRGMNPFPLRSLREKVGDEARKIFRS